MAQTQRRGKAGGRTDLGARVREIREALGLTQEQLAEKSGVDRAEISRLETWDPRARNPGVERLGKIAAALGVEIGALFTPSDGASHATQ